MTLVETALNRCTAIENKLNGVQLAFEMSDDWLWDLDLEARTLKFTGDWYLRLGFKEQDDVGLEVLNRWTERIHPDDYEKAIKTFGQIIVGQLHRGEIKYRLREVTGDYFWVLSRINSLRNEQGELIRLVGINSDIDIFHKSFERLEDLAYTDLVTGLNNRTALMTHLNDRFAQYDYSQVNGSVLLIGLDYFKYANTTYGHYVGDRILKTISEAVLKSVADPHAFVCRYESDQFCVVTNQVDDALTMALADRLLENISQTIHIEDDDFNITASIGISTFPLHGTSFEELIKNAESAMLAAKNSGKNKAVVYQYSMNQSLMEKWTISQELNNAIENEELKLVFQPIIDLENNQLRGFEALVRWHSKKLGLVPPNRFIPLAEEIGIINKVDIWVLNNAAEFIKRMNLSYDKDLYVSINISSLHLGKIELLGELKHIVEKGQVTPASIKIEITEHSLITSMEASQNMIHELKALGIEVFLDDFGTGYSSFNYLKNLPVDLVKLDMSFISDLLNDQHTERLVEGIIHLSHILNLKICAEGIEEKEQEHVLKKLACDFGQGYLYSKPMEEQDLCKMIEANSFRF